MRRINLLRYYQHMKLRHKMWTLFLFIIICYLIGLVSLLYFIMRNQIDSYAEKNNQNTLITIGKNFSSEVDKVNNFSRLLLTNDGVLKYLYANESELPIAYHKGVSSIYSVQNAYPGACSVFVFRQDGKYLTVGTGVTNVDKELLNSPIWLEPINQKKGGYVLQVNGNGVFHTNYEEKVLSLMRNINDIEVFQKRGMLAVNFPISVLDETYQGVANAKIQFGYLDKHGNILCTSDKEADFSKIKIGQKQFGQITEKKLFEEKIFSYYKLEDTGLTLICAEKVILWDSIAKEYIPILLFVSVFTILGFFLIHVFMSVYVTKPIQKMVEAMAYAKKGWLRRVSLVTCDDEIGKLKDSYNTMLLEMNDLINQLLDKEKVIRKSEVEIIQQQIKPHFLYNTIEMIACMALEADGKEVYDALETLGSFYRKFLSRGDNEVPLSTEIDIIRDYLKIEKLRYGDIFKEEFELDESCLKANVPKLILQPIVENSLYHGIRLKGEPGVIRVRIWKEDYIYIEIYDTGVGMSKEQIEHIWTKDSKSYGFKKTIERLQYYEGSVDVCKVESKEGFWTKVTLKIVDRNGKKKAE